MQISNQQRIAALLFAVVLMLLTPIVNKWRLEKGCPTFCTQHEMQSIELLATFDQLHRSLKSLVEQGEQEARLRLQQGDPELYLLDQSLKDFQACAQKATTTGSREACEQRAKESIREAHSSSKLLSK